MKQEKQQKRHLPWKKKLENDSSKKHSNILKNNCSLPKFDFKNSGSFWIFRYNSVTMQRMQPTKNTTDWTSPKESCLQQGKVFDFVKQLSHVAVFDLCQLSDFQRIEQTWYFGVQRLCTSWTWSFDTSIEKNQQVNF